MVEVELSGTEHELSARRVVAAPQVLWCALCDVDEQMRFQLVSLVGESLRAVPTLPVYLTPDSWVTPWHVPEWPSTAAFAASKLDSSTIGLQYSPRYLFE